MEHRINARRNPGLVRLEIWHNDAIYEQMFPAEEGMSNFGFLTEDHTIYRLTNTLADFIIKNLHIPDEDIAMQEHLPVGFVTHLRAVNLNYGESFDED